MKLAVVVVGLALAACAPRQDAPSCDLAVEREIAFTSAEARDRIVARAFGESCDKAIGHYAVLSQDGHPLWAWTAPLSRAFDMTDVAEREALNSFLTRWAAPRLSTTTRAPDWPNLAAGQTTLDRLTYDDIRARDLPMLCHFSGTNRETCVFWEPAAGAAGHFYDRDATETGESHP